MQFGTFDAPDLGSRLFQELTAKEATVVATIAAEAIPSALDRVMSEIGRPDESDPAASLRAVWIWFLGRLPSQQQQPAPRSWWRPRFDPAGASAAMSWHDVDPSILPYWCWFRDGSGIFLPLGPTICLDIEAVNAYVVTLLMTIHPGSEIVRCSGTPSDVDYRKPALRLADDREYTLPSRHMIDASRALDPEHSHHAASRDADRLVELLRMWVQRRDPIPVESTRIFDVVPRKQGAFDVIVNVDEVVAHEHSERLDALVTAAMGEEPVERAHREDRDVLLLAAPTLTADQIWALLDRIWHSLNQ